ncbi:MAG: LysR family transcriptional regulator [Lysobacteraceae bacterium]
MTIAKAQYEIAPADLEIVLALVRTGTLATAGERLAVNASTVFRSLQRIELGLGARLFLRSRSGYAPTELALLLAEQAEHVEAAVEASRAAVRQQSGAVAGTVRLTTTDSVLHGLVAPAIAVLGQHPPLLAFDLQTGNELASLTRRDADIAVRATRRPPPHLVGRRLGPIRVAVFVAARHGIETMGALQAVDLPWVAPDDVLPEHPSVVWRRRAFPRVVPRYRVSSILTVARRVRLGLAVGVLPLFLAADLPDLRQVGPVIDDAETDLWLLTHPQARHMRRISTVYQYLADTVRLA